LRRAGTSAQKEHGTWRCRPPQHPSKSVRQVYGLANAPVYLPSFTASGH